MAFSFEELVSKLSDIEPTESTYEGITEAEIPDLERIMQTQEPWLAARSVFALSRLRPGAAAPTLKRATQSPTVEVRVALAASAADLPPALSNELLPPWPEDKHEDQKGIVAPGACDSADAWGSFRS